MMARSLDERTRSANNQALLDALTEVVNDLRIRQLTGSPMATRVSLRQGTDRLARTLANHLRYTEETLFPALRELQPGAKGVLDGMESSHWPLRQSARDLTAQMKVEDEGESHRTARTFLAMLMNHVGVEATALNGILGALEEGQSRRLNQVLSERS